MTTVLLLICSNVFMTFAWYGHLKYGQSWPLWQAILLSWLIAGLEYCLAVPANRLGYLQFTGFQLKILQEAITLLVFVVFLGQPKVEAAGHAHESPLVITWPLRFLALFSIIGGFIGQSIGVGPVTGVNFTSIIVAVLGSIILLIAYRMLRREA